jgi:hypothetical protein
MAVRQPRRQNVICCEENRMITGIINANFEPIIPLSICGSDGKIRTQFRSIQSLHWQSMLTQYLDRQQFCKWCLKN